MSRDMPPPLGIAGIRHICGYPLRVPLRVGQLEPNSGRYSAKPIELPNMQGLERSLSDHIGVAVWILPPVAADAKESFCGLCASGMPRRGDSNGGITQRKRSMEAYIEVDLNSHNYSCM